MEMMNRNPAETVHQVNNTMYQVTSVFREAPQAERLEDKIERLILKECENNAPL